MVKVQIDSKAVKGAIQQAFRDTALVISAEFTKAITDPIYPWDRGESPRDIVDTGRLRASQQYQVFGTSATWLWNVDYSLPVHNGAVLRNGTVLQPRRWTKVAFDRRPPKIVFEQLLTRYL